MRSHFGAQFAPPHRSSFRRKKNPNSSGNLRINVDVGSHVHALVQNQLVPVGTQTPPAPRLLKNGKAKAQSAQQKAAASLAAEVVVFLRNICGLRVIGAEVPICSARTGVATGIDLVARRTSATNTRLVAGKHPLVVIELKVGLQNRFVGDGNLKNIPGSAKRIPNNPRNHALLQLGCTVGMLSEAYQIQASPMLVIANNTGVQSVPLPPWVKNGVRIPD